MRIKYESMALKIICPFLILLTDGCLMSRSSDQYFNYIYGENKITDNKSCR